MARKPLASAAEVSEFLQTPEKTLANWRSQGRGPAWRKVGREVRYDWIDVDEWIKSLPGKPLRAA